MSAKQTPLYEEHVAHNAKIISFAGWLMPISYGSQIKEHECVRNDAGVFDVSHMGIVDVTGEDTELWLRTVLANDIAKLEHEGQALYSLMLNESGGIVDDLIVYRLTIGYRLVINAGAADKDLVWLKQQANGYAVNLELRADLAMLAVQGPNALSKFCSVQPLWADEIQRLRFFEAKSFGAWLIARTGYTGEDGLEIMLPQQAAVSLFRQLLAAGVQACGLGARDTLRLEAGLNLYGQDMDEATTPLEVGLGWTVAWSPDQRQFIGRAALMKQKDKVPSARRVGLILDGRGIMRAGQTVVLGANEVGNITSATFSPTLRCSIALARIPITCNEPVMVEIRGAYFPVRIVKLPFIPRRHNEVTLT